MRSVSWLVAFATVVTLATYCVGADESYAPQSLTLQQCIDLALKQNPDILKAQQEIRRTHGVIVEARAAALPQLTASGQYERIDRNFIDRSRLGPTNPPSILFENQEQPWSAMMEAQKKTVEEAEEGLRLAEVRYRAGSSAQLEVLSAQTALTEARSNEVQAMYDYNVADATLQRPVGATVKAAG